MLQDLFHTGFFAGFWQRSLSSSSHGRLHRAGCEGSQYDSWFSPENKEEAVVSLVPSLGSHTLSRHFHNIVFFRNEPLSPVHIPMKGNLITRGVSKNL